MKSVKLPAMILLMSILMSALCCGCSKDPGTTTTGKPDDEHETKTVEKLPEDELLIIRDYKNYAEGYQSDITFVMSDGSVYSSREYFNGYSSDWEHSLSDEDRAALLKKYTLPVAEIPESQLLKIYNSMINIDPGAKFAYSEETACDAGTGVTKVNVDGAWIKTEEYGDRNGELDDRYARKFNDLLDGAFDSFRKTRKDPANVYSSTETFIRTFECTRTVSKDTKRIITNIDELKAFEKDTGIDLQNNESFAKFGDPDYDSFRWCYIAVEIIVYPKYLSLEDVSADAFIVADNYTGFGYIKDPVIDPSEDVVEQKCYCHVVQIPDNDSGIYDGFFM